jgi:hypothetical protein
MMMILLLRLLTTTANYFVQNILCQLIYQGKDIPVNTVDICPWLEFRMPPIEVQSPILEGNSDRRQLKTHLRLDAVVFSPKAKYIYVGRDARDCYMSLVNHYRSGNENWYNVLNLAPGKIYVTPVARNIFFLRVYIRLVGSPLPYFTEEEHSEKALFDRWISEGNLTFHYDNDGYPFGPCLIMWQPGGSFTTYPITCSSTMWICSRTPRSRFAKLLHSWRFRSRKSCYLGSLKQFHSKE